MYVYSIQIHIHSGKLPWNLQITRLQRKLIFQTSILVFDGNFPGCMKYSGYTYMKSGLTKQIHQKNPSAKTNVHENIQVLFGDNPPPFVPKNLTANQSRPSEMRG